MFLPNSRYHKAPTVGAATGDGRTVRVLKLRRIPSVEGEPHEVRGTDRLDLLSEITYGDPSRFWHIADANSELEAAALVREMGREIRLPRR